MLYTVITFRDYFEVDEEKAEDMFEKQMLYD